MLRAHLRDRRVYWKRRSHDAQRSALRGLVEPQRGQCTCPGAQETIAEVRNHATSAPAMTATGIVIRGPNTVLRLVAFIREVLAKGVRAEPETNRSAEYPRNGVGKNGTDAAVPLSPTHHAYIVPHFEHTDTNADE